MSQDGDEDVPKPKEPEPIKDYKIFLDNMNSWFSSFFIEQVRTDQSPEARTRYEFMGTKQTNHRLLPRHFQPKEIKIDFNFNYVNEVFSNDIFIYNMEDADYKEVDYVIKGLKALKYETEKVLVIVTSIMTWARTTPKYRKENEEEEESNPEENAVPVEEKEPESEDEEYIIEVEPEEEGKEEEPKEELKEDEEGKEPEPPKKILYFKEKDYIKRVPSIKYYQHKMTETLALSNTNPMLKTYIVCSGFIYGCGENMFYDYFKMAWLQQPPKLPLILKGKNTIPTIHIKDLIALIKRIIEARPPIKYIFAIDHTKNRQLKNIIASISKGVGTGQIENLDENQKNRIPFYDELVIDVKARPTKLFLDEKRDDEEDEEFEKRTFKWHCEFGIPENLDKLRKEFNEYRGLKNVKIMLTGPPASGKTYLGSKLSSFYNIPHFLLNDIIEWGKKLTDELGEEIKAKSEEIETATKEAEETYLKRPNKKKTDLPLDISQMKKFPEEIIIKLLRRRLGENICLNRGYVLDGYPKGYKNAYALFMEDTDDSKPPEDETKFKLMSDLVPNSVIRIENCNESILHQRLMALEDFKSDPTFHEKRMERRLAQYNELNASKRGDLSLTDFYKENHIDVIGINGILKEEEIIDQCKVFIERNGKIINYQIFDNEKEKSEKNEIVSVIDKVAVKVDSEIKENEFFDNAKAEVKDAYNKDKIDKIKEVERQLLETKSNVLRRYLAENVIPVLSKGILHVCQQIPEDPVDALAYYLLDNAFNAKFPPHKYKDTS